MYLYGGSVEEVQRVQIIVALEKMGMAERRPGLMSSVSPRQARTRSLSSKRTSPDWAKYFGAWVATPTKSRLVEQ